MRDVRRHANGCMLLISASGCLDFRCVKSHFIIKGDVMRQEITGVSLWGILFVGSTLLGAAGTAAPALGVAATAILGNVAASKLQRLVDAFHDYRAQTGQYGGKVNRDHDEARALRKAQLSALRSLARANCPKFSWTLNNRRRNLCKQLDKWAGAAMKQSDAALEQALRTAAPQTLTQLSGAAPESDALITANELKDFVVNAVWDEIKAALTIWDDQADDDAAWLKSAFLNTETGWFSLFSLQWHAVLKADPKVSALVQHMQQALLVEKVDAIKADVAATLSGIDALPDTVTARMRQMLLDTGVIAEAQRRGLSDTQLHGVLAAFGKNGLPPDEWERGLLDSAERLTELEALLSGLSNEVPEIAALTQAAGTAIHDGQFMQADVLLAEAEQLEIDAGVSRLKRAADTRFKRGELARSQQDHWTAGQHFEAAADLIKAHVPIDAARFYHWAGVAFLVHGRMFPGPSIDRAVKCFRMALGLITLDAMPKQWAIIQNDLGAALQIQGERTQGKKGLALLNDSAKAFRAAIRVRTRDPVRLDWAGTQNNLSNTLRVLGERTAGEEGLAFLTDSVTACHAALEVFTRDGTPDSWAGAHSNLSNTLCLKGERTPGDEGLVFLSESVKSCRAALKVFTRKLRPDGWAMTQNNLGNSLKSLGIRTKGNAGLNLLTKSVAAYREALKVRKIKTMPADWALTQSNLGNALRVLGERTGGEAGLKLLTDSINASCSALEVNTRVAMPANWAFTHENIAVAALARFDISANDADLSIAQTAAKAAMEVYRSGGMEFHAEKCARLIGEITARAK